MNAVQNMAIPAPVRQPQLVLGQGRKTAADGAAFLLYVLILGGAAIHLYHTPIYSMDSIQYMGNALLMEERDPVRIHQRVYDDVRRSVPRAEREGLLGHVEGTTPDYAESRRTRAANPYQYAEFLPLFAIRPLYNQTLWLVSKRKFIAHMPRCSIEANCSRDAVCCRLNSGSMARLYASGMRC